MGGDAGVEGVDAFEPFGREGEVGANFAVEAREEEGATDVREEADGRLGHGEHCSLRGYSERCVHAQPYASAHRDAVHEGDVGFRVGGYEMVELVFETEVVFRLLLSGWSFGVVLS